MEHSHGKAVQDELMPLARDLRKAIPDVYAGFAALHKTSMAEGALPTKMKELIALAIAVVERCDGCIASHARGAVRAGAVGRPCAGDARRNDDNRRRGNSRIESLVHATSHGDA